MRSITVSAIAVATAITLGTAHAGLLSSSKSSKKIDTSSKMGKVSYTIGYDIGKNFKKQNIDINAPTMMAGLQSGLAGKKPQMSQKQMESTMQSFRKQMIKKAVAKQKKESAANQKKSQKYLKKVASKSGVHKIEDGLYYKELKSGHGNKPKADDTVTVNYKGTLPNGKVFDSSYKRGKPATFKLSEVIPGWSKALQQMPVGSTWKIYIAPKLGYGKYAPPQIGPNQALTFKVKLIKIDQKQEGDQKSASHAPQRPASPAHASVPAHPRSAHPKHLPPKTTAVANQQAS